MKNKLFIIGKYFAAFSIMLFSQALLANDDFPGRKIYQNVPYIITEDLHKELENTIVIDARSPFEYQTLRIKGAINVPLSLPSDKFQKKMRAIRAESPNKIVFYCNGHSCMKSYKAARRAILFAKIDNVFVYDAGIFDWSNEHPDLAELLGKPLRNPAKLISKANLKKHMVPALEFIKKADESTIVLDVRDRVQRDGFYIFSGYENSIPLNESDRIQAIIKKAKRSKKHLYIYDAVGKQVRWLQYYLEANKVANYYFMEGGARAFFTIPVNELMDS